MVKGNQKLGKEVKQRVKKIGKKELWKMDINLKKKGIVKLQKLHIETVLRKITAFGIYLAA